MLAKVVRILYLITKEQLSEEVRNNKVSVIGLYFYFLSIHPTPFQRLDQVVFDDMKPLCVFIINGITVE